ncbi:MAG: mandelate racemase/muconate lactonizing enzyme family protein [Halobacteria archaeon]
MAVRIRKVAVEELSIPLPKPFRAAWRAGVPETRSDLWVVRLQTGDLEGFGVGLSLSRGEAEMVERYLRALLVGLDPEKRDMARPLFRFVAFLGSRLWAVELALWDLAAKARGVSVAEMAGQARDRVPLYASTGEVKPAPERLKEVAEWRRQGFRAVKLRAHSFRWQDDLATLRAVREANPGLTLMVDANQGWNLPPGPVWDLATAREFARGCNSLGVLWLEEPLDRDDWEGLKRLRAESKPLLIVGGELDTAGPPQFRKYLEMGIYDGIQPDLVLSTGFAGALEAGRLARERSALFTPHTWTTGYGLGASLHAAACFPGSVCPWLEYPLDPPGWTVEHRDRILKEPLRPDPDGNLRVKGPGFGMELDESVVEEFRAPP